MKIKHLIMTRWWMQPTGFTKTILDDEILDERLNYLVNHLFVSLNNQTNHDFEFIVQVHPNHTNEQIEKISVAMKNANPNFKASVMVWNDGFHNYVESLWKENDIVLLTRIDDDDFVNKNAVQDTRDLIGNGQFDMVVCGYHYGYKYFDGDDKLIVMRPDYNGGHMSIFQTVISNTKRVQFSKYANPCMFNHTKIRKQLNEFGYNIWFVAFDRPDGYIWFRHKNAISYNKSDSGEVINLDSQMAEHMKDTFGISISGEN